MGLRFRPRMEMLDRRDVPSTTIVDAEPFTLTGPAGTLEGTLTVVEDEPGYYGYYHWHYVLENVSYGCSAGCYPEQTFQVDAGSVSGVENLQSSAGWDGAVYAAPDGSGSIVWNRTNGSPILPPDGTAEFSFLTVPTPIYAWGGTFVDDDPMGASATGELLAPEAGRNATVDFTNATTGKAYTIAISVERQTGPNTYISQRVLVDIPANYTTQNIRAAVEQKLKDAGVAVSGDGANRLTIGWTGVGRLTKIEFTLGTTVVNGDVDPDLTLTGPGYVGRVGEVTVKVNGTKISP